MYAFTQTLCHGQDVTQGQFLSLVILVLMESFLWTRLKTIQVRQTRHAGHCWRSKDELISDVLLWTPAYGQAKAGRPARTYIQQLCDDTGCNPEDLPEAMNNREKWRERVRDIRAGGTTWCWWWCIFIIQIIPLLLFIHLNIKFKDSFLIVFLICRSRYINIIVCYEEFLKSVKEHVSLKLW